MAKAAFVTYLIALSIISSSGYQQECAVGPEYWCKSFQTAEDCGALRHCTDTVWRYDEKSTNIDSSTTCEWCSKILESTHQSIQHLADNEDLIRSSLVKGCELFPLASTSSKCTNALEHYGKSVGSLMKHKRYATLCRLMTICSAESPVTEKPKILGSKRCTWGPSYWCSSLSNTRECSSIDHCSNKIWSQQSIEKKPEDKMCQYCEFTISKLRSIIEDNKTDINIEKWLSGACSMLSTKESIDECVQRMSQYATEILVLIKTNIDPGVICHLAELCKDATVRTRVTIENTPAEDTNAITLNNDQSKVVDEESKMLCNVIVRATHELHVDQKKSRNEIQEFLKNDCQKLSTTELVQKCVSLIDKHGIDIHEQVASHIKLSKICDYIDDFADQSSLQSLPNVHCELCTFVLTTAKYMLNAKQSEDTILRYIDEQICSRLTGSAKKTCQQMIEFNGKDLINNIECGTKSMLLCTRFQICIDQVLSPTSSVEKNEKNQFLKENICDNLGSFKDACYALIEKDGTRLMSTLFNDMEGDVLCRIFGICPKRMSFIDNLSINDDKNKCKRCVDDFTRRKHIAEKLVNHSAEFLHHLCGQLPEKDACIKTVDESINELITFVQSLDPQDICEQLKYCNKTLLEQIQPIELTSTDNIISQEIITYIKTEICSKLGTLAEMCDRTIDTEGPSILAMIAKDIDPKKACVTLGICSGSSSFENCQDKCECCMDKIEIHEVQVGTFLKAMVESIKTLCQHMPGNDQCLQMTTKFDSNINQITSRFNAKQVCQGLNHCSTLPVEIETLSQCQTRIESKKQFLLSAISTINQNLKSLCEYIPWNKDCYAIIDRSTLDTNDKLSQLNTETVCTSGQSLTDLICIKASPFESLCKQLVVSDENNLRMEAIFKSMFNQNGNVEKELCELQSTDCQSSVVNLDNCKDKCDCCVQFYTTKKNYDLSVIEAYRTGLLATCDWSLSKDYCISWFNRVCDRMKAKVDEFIPTTYCKRIGLCPIEDNQCKATGDKCQCCKNRLTGRGNRFRRIVSEVTNALTSLCTDNDCRSMVQSAQQQTLSQIDRIDSQTYCQRYGYCSSESSFYMSRLLATHVGSDIEALDQRFEAAISSDICFQYGQLRPMCEHLMASAQGHRYGYVYSALLNNNPKLIDDDLREQMQTNVNTDVCTSCKNAVQSSKDFWTNALESVRNVLLTTCNYCSVKEQCRDYYNQRLDNIKSYLNNIDPAQFCQTLHLCSTSLCANMGSFQQACEESLSSFTHDSKTIEEHLPHTSVVVLPIQSENEEIHDLTFDSNSTCILCEYAMHILANYIHQQSTEQEIEQSLQKVCNQMPGTLKSQCHELIDNYGPAIIAILIGHFDVSTICQKLNLCPNQMKVELSHITKADIASCGVCDYVSTYVHFALKRDSSEKSLKHALSTVCTHLSSEQIPQCQTIVQLIGSNIRQLQLGPGNNFCKELTICQTPMSELKPAIHLNHKSTVEKDEELKQVIVQNLDDLPQCTLCRYVVTYLDAFLKNNKSEAAVEAALARVCTILPRKERVQCSEFVKTYGPVLAELVSEMADPKLVCRYLGMCQVVSPQDTTTEKSTPITYSNHHYARIPV